MLLRSCFLNLRLPTGSGDWGVVEGVGREGVEAEQRPPLCPQMSFPSPDSMNMLPYTEKGT